MPKGITINPTPRECTKCGKQYIPNSNCQKYCSYECYYISYKKLACERTKKYNKKHGTSSWRMRMKILERLGKKCTICGFDDWRALQIDHIHGGGGKELRKYKNTYQLYKYINSLPDDELKANYQVLCANHNFIKRFENNELMG